jgi:hypothetical protein
MIPTAHPSPRRGWRRGAVRAAALACLAFIMTAACSGNDIGGGEGGAPACTTCAEVYINGGIACGPGPSVDAWHALANCACSGPCVGSCIQSFCVGTSADMNCDMCLAQSCSQELSNCGMN